MPKLRVALAGAGNIARSAHMPVYQKRDDVEVVAVCDLNEARARECAAMFNIPHVYTDAAEMVRRADIDCVDICVWNASHAPIAIEAARAGKHILCEKPMALNMEHARAMEAAVKQSGVLFMMAMPRRFESDVQLLADMVRAGELGDIYYAKTSMLRRRGTPLGWFTDLSKSGGGPVIDIGPHALDRVWFLMGCPKPVRVSASVTHAIGDYQTRGVSRWVALDSDVTAFDTEDSAAGTIHFENGASLLFELSWALNAEPGESTVICGSKGGASLGPLTIYTENAMGYLSDNRPTVQPVNGFEAEIAHFLDCVRTGRQPSPSLEDGMQLMKMLMGIYASAQEGKELPL